MQAAVEFDGYKGMAIDVYSKKHLRRCGEKTEDLVRRENVF
jgi:hypothetical protein